MILKYSHSEYNQDILEWVRVFKQIQHFFVHVGESLKNVIQIQTQFKFKQDVVIKSHLDLVTEDDVDEIILNFRESTAG